MKKDSKMTYESVLCACSFYMFDRITNTFLFNFLAIDLFFNTQIKIGIYIAKPIGGSRTYSCDNIPFGLKAIIKELDKSKYNYQFCNKNNYNNFEFHKFRFKFINILNFTILKRLKEKTETTLKFMQLL